MSEFKTYYEEEGRTSSLFIPKILLLFGIPGSGKSTFLKTFNKSGHWKIVSPDNLRKTICGDISCQDRNFEIFNIAKEQLIKYLEVSKDVIIDATNLNKKTRDFFCADLPTPVEKLVHIIDVDPEICKQRIRKDIEMGIDRSNCPDFVVDRMYNNFKSNIGLLDGEGFKRI